MPEPLEPPNIPEPPEPDFEAIAGPPPQLPEPPEPTEPVEPPAIQFDELVSQPEPEPAASQSAPAMGPEPPDQPALSEPASEPRQDEQLPPGQVVWDQPGQVSSSPPDSGAGDSMIDLLRKISEYTRDTLMLLRRTFGDGS